ncbi:MAG: transcriptional regulator GcvA [Rhodospirillales bacterium]|jgi:LysR family transcriptional regulator, glycine cleavage system transcriptional activator|nr:transcriptional regulator GcvA [Rhodospirillales bacterium]
MSKQLPPLNALRAFEAAARHLSFTKGANELNVTQGAVSHQVKALEDRLGLKLFLRRHQGLVLTEAGQNCQLFVRDAFDRLSAGFDNLLDKDDAGILTVSVSPNFASKWLVPRIGRFTETYPDIDLRLSASHRHVDLNREDVDLAIRHGEDNWPDLHAVSLATETLFPVCSPNLMEGAHPLTHNKNLAHHTLLHLDSRKDWVKWFDAAGIEGADLSKGTVFNQANLALDAAASGQGVALGRRALAASDLIAKRLVMPFGPVLAVKYAYYIVCPKQTANRPKIKAFRDWMIREAKADNDGLEALGIPALTDMD